MAVGPGAQHKIESRLVPVLHHRPHAVVAHDVGEDFSLNSFERKPAAKAADDTSGRPCAVRR
jgi:hypothetical protein